MIAKSSQHLINPRESILVHNPETCKHSVNGETLEIDYSPATNISPGDIATIWVTVRNPSELAVSDVKIEVTEVTQPLVFIKVNPNSIPQLRSGELSTFCIIVFAPHEIIEDEYSIVFRVVCQSLYIRAPLTFFSSSDKNVTIFVRPRDRWYIV